MSTKRGSHSVALIIALNGSCAQCLKIAFLVSNASNFQYCIKHINLLTMYILSKASRDTTASLSFWFVIGSFSATSTPEEKRFFVLTFLSICILKGVESGKCPCLTPSLSSWIKVEVH
jgi:hypothetical protein